MCTLYTLMGAVIFALVIGTISEMAQQENRFTNAVSHNLHGSLSLSPPPLPVCSSIPLRLCILSLFLREEHRFNV
jgi:hypothetical protein